MKGAPLRFSPTERKIMSTTLSITKTENGTMVFVSCFGEAIPLTAFNGSTLCPEERGAMVATYVHESPQYWDLNAILRHVFKENPNWLKSCECDGDLTPEQENKMLELL